MKISPVHISRLCCIITVMCLVVGGPLRAQERSRNTASLSFIFLPLRTSPELEMAAEQFMDEFLKVIRMQGHNAVSTRYLRSILLDWRFGALEACTTSVCMKNLVRVVGARFIVHGSLISDSSSGLVIELHVIDVPGNYEVASQIETFKKNPAASGPQVLDFTEKILQKVTTSKGKVIPEPVVLLQNDTAISVQSTITVPEKSDTVVQNEPMDTTAVTATKVKQLDSVSFKDSVNLPNSSPIQSQTVEQNELIPAEESTVIDEVAKTADTVIETVAISESPQVNSTEHIPGIDTSEKLVIANDTLIYDNVSLTTVETHADSIKTDTSGTIVEPSQKTNEITQVTLTQSVPDQANIILQTIGPVAPSEALNNKPKEKKTFKRIRIAGFGLIALSGFAGGIITNEYVKKSLKEETALFNLYMKADAERTEDTYQRYISQTDKTDAKIRQRSLLYALSVLGLTACTVSIRF